MPARRIARAPENLNSGSGGGRGAGSFALGQEAVRGRGVGRRSEPDHPEDGSESRRNGALQERLRPGVAEQAAMAGSVVFAMLRDQRGGLRNHEDAHQRQQDQASAVRTNRKPALVLWQTHQNYIITHLAEPGLRRGLHVCASPMDRVRPPTGAGRAAGPGRSSCAASNSAGVAMSASVYRREKLGRSVGFLCAPARRRHLAQETS